MLESDAFPDQTREDDVLSEPKFKYAGTVRAGEWDRTGTRFEDTAFYRGFEAHFREGVPWEETAFHDRALDLIADGVGLWGCDSPAAFRERCADLDRLYARIDEQGYHSQRALAESGTDPFGASARPLTLRQVYDEVTVCIDRNGRFVFADGRNRLAIAKVLGLESIPVWVLFRHEYWQRFREEVAADPGLRAALPPRLRAHPDLPGDGD